MAADSSHPDSHTHGLADDCPRCAEHAEHPIQSLDERNLARLMAVAVDPNRLGNNTYTDNVAAAKVLTAMEHAGHLARTSPYLFFTFLRRYGIYAEPHDRDGIPLALLHRDDER